jgi:hypothetical protein
MRYSLTGFFSASVLLSACASIPRYATPCQIQGVTVVLMSADAANSYCHRFSHLDDDGNAVLPETRILGCAFPKANPPMVVVQDDTINIAHELRHVFDERCK